MTETVWPSVAPGKSELTSFYKMEDRAVPAAVREDNAMLHTGASGTQTSSTKGDRLGSGPIDLVETAVAARFKLPNLRG